MTPEQRNTTRRAIIQRALQLALDWRELRTEAFVERYGPGVDWGHVRDSLNYGLQALDALQTPDGAYLPDVPPRSEYGPFGSNTLAAFRERFGDGSGRWKGVTPLGFFASGADWARGETS